jgi:coenzyme F420-reducing hydrogenase gamma subunit
MSIVPQDTCPAGHEKRASLGADSVSKPRIGIFSLTGCEGCSLAILELEDRLLALLDAVEVVNFREGMSEGTWDFDIGFVEGAVTTPHDEEQVQRIRASCKTLVAVGACACLGGINTLKHEQLGADYRRYVYGDRALLFPTADARPLSALVSVDHELPGCPMVKEEFLRLVTGVLAGRPFRLPTYPVCVECKRRGVLCLYEKGEMCLGPVTRAGCNAICPFFGARCEACRGVLGEESLVALGRNLREQYQAPAEDVLVSLRRYGAFPIGDLP